MWNGLVQLHNILAPLLENHLPWVISTAVQNIADTGLVGEIQGPKRTCAVSESV